MELNLLAQDGLAHQWGDQVMVAYRDQIHPSFSPGCLPSHRLPIAGIPVRGIPTVVPTGLGQAPDVLNETAAVARLGTGIWHIQHLLDSIPGPMLVGGPPIVLVEYALDIALAVA